MLDIFLRCQRQRLKLKIFNAIASSANILPPSPTALKNF
jgi:hypothetical protein